MIGDIMELLTKTTQWVIVVATIIEILAWVAMAWAIRYYAPYRRKEE